MKAKLEFDLEDCSDKLAHRRSVNATNAYLALYEIDNLLREMTKYGKNISPGDKIALPKDYHVITEKQSQILHVVIDEIRGSISSILETNNINMDDLE